MNVFDARIIWKPRNLIWGLALLELPFDVNFTSTKYRPICLPTDDSEDYAGVTAIATGWGTLNATSGNLSKVI